MTENKKEFVWVYFLEESAEAIEELLVQMPTSAILEIDSENYIVDAMYQDMVEHMSCTVNEYDLPILGE